MKTETIKILLNLLKKEIRSILIEDKVRSIEQLKLSDDLELKNEYPIALGFNSYLNDLKNAYKEIKFDFSSLQEYSEIIFTPFQGLIGNETFEDAQKRINKEWEEINNKNKDK